MWRGTTPTHTFTFPTDVDLESMSVIFGAFMRGNKPPVLLGEDKNFSI